MEPPVELMVETAGPRFIIIVEKSLLSISRLSLSFLTSWILCIILHINLLPFFWYPSLPPSFTTRRPSHWFPWRVAAWRPWGIRQGGPCPPRSAADGHHLQGRPPVPPGHQGSDPRPEEDLAIRQPQLQQPLQPGELGRLVSVCWIRHMTSETTNYCLYTRVFVGFYRY